MCPWNKCYKSLLNTFLILAYLLRSIHMLQLGDAFANAILSYENLSSRCAVFLSSQPKGEGTHIAFDADPVSVRIALCPCVIF